MVVTITAIAVAINAGNLSSSECSKYDWSTIESPVFYFGTHNWSAVKKFSA